MPPNDAVAHALSGPGDVWLKLGPADWTQLGYSESGVRVEFAPEFFPLFNDRRGPTTPYARLTTGLTAAVSLTLAEWDFALYERAKAIAFTQGTAGRFNRLQVGAKATGLQLAIRHSFYGTVNATPGLPPGYAFYEVFLRPNALGPIGVAGPRLAITFDAEGVWDTPSASWRVYHTDATFFATLPPPC
ncbi:hypothetical protein [Limnoglobus roseus]|uniref:Uncharacterized protein n=1 Tax=Limnoglobus roseus TaxID=2598579 RepID=A0A5C1AJR4_9BACT|nr:hypothetical protein [Limnoglobus roseus]QEL17148.1 hypothetical protein PX52LOC_04129 [Limnoglobus roseus]